MQSAGVHVSNIALMISGITIVRRVLRENNGKAFPSCLLVTAVARWKTRKWNCHSRPSGGTSARGRESTCRMGPLPSPWQTPRLAGDDIEFQAPPDTRDIPFVYHCSSSGGDNGAPPTAAWEARQGDQCVLEHGHCRARGGYGSDFVDRVDVLTVSTGHDDRGGEAPANKGTSPSPGARVPPFRHFMPPSSSRGEERKEDDAQFRG